MQEGYIVDPGTGRQSRPFVAPLTREDASELFHIVAEIEGLAAWRASKQKDTEGLVGRLDAINSSLLSEAQSDSPSREQIFRLDTRFHRTYMVGGAGPRLLALHEAIKPQTERYMRLYIEVLLDQIAVVGQEHEAITNGDCGRRGGPGPVGRKK